MYCVPEKGAPDFRWYMHFYLMVPEIVVVRFIPH